MKNSPGFAIFPCFDRKINFWISSPGFFKAKVFHAFKTFKLWKLSSLETFQDLKHNLHTYPRVAPGV